MKKNVKKVRMLLIILVLNIVCMPAASVEAKKSKNYWPKLSEKITAGAAILMDVDTGTILYKKNINKAYYPASITKILTTLVAIENSSMDEVVTFSADAVYKTAGGSSIWRDIGEVMTMEQCLYAVMLESANECAYAVAEHIGGTMQKFVKMMNEKAKELGCKDSKFMNPHGLPDEKHYLTAKDMAIIAKAAYENETFRLICGTKRYTIPPTNKHNVPTYMVNHHKMLYPKDTAAYLYDYCLGGKTGYTNAAGNTLVTYAQKDGMTLLAVILNGTSPEYWKETRALFDFGFENFNLCNVSEYFGADDSYEEEKYDSLNTNDPYAQIDPQARIILPKTVSFDKATMKISYDHLPEDALAQLVYTYGKRPIGTADIIRTHSFIEKGESVVNAKTDASAEDSDESAADRQETETDGMKDGQDQKPLKETDPDLNQDQETETDSGSGQDSKEKKPGVFQGLMQKVKDFDLLGKIQSIDLGDIFSNVMNWFKNLKFEFSVKSVVIAAGILLAVILLVVFKVVFDKSYVIRQRMANYRNRKRAQRQYTIIRDSRKTRRGWRKKR